MARYSVNIFVDGNNINTIRNQIKKAFPGQETAVEKINLNMSRADRLGEVERTVDDAKSTVEELKDEMQNWYDSLPENLQNGDKADQIQSCIDELENLSGALDDLDFSSVEFPEMMG